MTMRYFRALESLDGPFPIRTGDILRARVRRPVDVAAFLPVVVELLDGPPPPNVPVRTVSAATFLIDLDARPGETVH